MSTRGSRSEKVKRIFQQFDLNRDGGLNRDEMSALVVAVNPRVRLSDEPISAILDEVFRTYGEFIAADKGLTYDGLLRTYDDGAGDVDRDFEALALELNTNDDNDNNNEPVLEEEVERKVGGPFGQNLVRKYTSAGFGEGEGLAEQESLLLTPISGFP